MQFTPLHLHTSWLIANSLNGMPNNSTPEAIAEELSAPRASSLFPEALQLTRELAWVEDSAAGLTLTSEGKKAISKHWRFYRTSNAKINKYLDQTGLTRALLNEAQEEQKPKLLDLFCGVGGLSLGFEAEGFRTKVAIDNDPEACEAHEANFSHCKVLNADINQIAQDPKSKLLDLAGTNEFDGVIGGPPCQGFSHMGERSIADDRSFLTTRFAEIVVHLQPKFFLIENVPGLQKIGAKKDFLSWAANFSAPIGLYATELANALPQTPKSLGKRDRQFRKRTVSTIIKAATATLAADEALQWKSLDEKFRAACTIFRETADAALGGPNFNSEADWAQKAVDAIHSADLTTGKLLWSTIIRVELSRKLNRQGKEALLSAIASFAEENPQSYYAELLRKHANEPTTQDYEGIEVGPVLYSLLKKLDDDYQIYGPKVLVATEYGSPQLRKRLFIVGIRKDIKRKFAFPAPTHTTRLSVEHLPSAPTCFDAISDLPEVELFPELLSGDKFPSTNLGLPTATFQETARLIDSQSDEQTLPRLDWNPFFIDASKRTIHAEHVIERLRSTKEGIQDSTSGKTRLRANGYSVTLRAGTREGKGSHTAVRPIHYEYDRVVTVREGARLMGFPDWLKLHETKWHGFRLVGNAVPKHFGQALAKAIMETIK